MACRLRRRNADLFAWGDKRTGPAKAGPVLIGISNYSDFFFFPPPRETCASFSFAEPHVSGRVGRRPWHLPEKIWPLLAGECLPRAVSCLFPGRRCHLLAGRCHPPDKRCLPFAAGCLHLYRRCRAQVDNGALCFKYFLRDTASSR